MCTGAAAVKVKVDVHVRQTGFDSGSFVELKTAISASGNGHSRTITQNYNNLRENTIYSGYGVKVASYVFSGSYFPRTIKVRMTETDNESSDPHDDGICFVELTNIKYDYSGIWVKCIRQGENGLRTNYVINAKIARVN